MYSKEIGDATLASQTEDHNVLRVGLGIRDLSGLYLSLIYEKQDSPNYTKNTEEVDIAQIQAGYKFGNSMLKAMYGAQDMENNNEDVKSWAVGIDHSFAKRTTVYALYTNYELDDKTDKDLGDWKGFSLGMIHNF